MEFRSFYLELCLLLCCSTLLIRAIPIDNGVEGDPEVQCLADSIQIEFNTRNPFEGKVYVKNNFFDPDCSSANRTGASTGITVAFDKCNTKRERSLEPRGVFVRNTIVISFHKTFVTKIDRAYTIQCFYMEADKTVSQELEVSAITTGLQTLTVPMPVCRYEILEGGPTGNPIKFVLIGDAVYHKWICDTDTVDTFCMVVYDCFVDDGEGDKIQLINEDGCAIDKFLLNNLEYPTDLMAGQEAHVFKYADRANLYFNCQIRLTIKEPGEACPQPQCPALLRKKRSPRGQRKPVSKRSATGDEMVVDVSYRNDVLVGDIELTEQDIPPSVRHSSAITSGNRVLSGERLASPTADQFCISTVGFSMMLALSCFLMVATVVTTVQLCSSRATNHKQQQLP